MRFEKDSRPLVPDFPDKVSYGRFARNREKGATDARTQKAGAPGGACRPCRSAKLLFAATQVDRRDRRQSDDGQGGNRIVAVNLDDDRSAMSEN